VPPDAPAELLRTLRFLLALLSDAGPPAQAAAEALFESGRGIGALERAAVYQRMYRLRFAREVAREYPATRALLGEAAFGALARDFVAAHGSRSFTLEGYARELPGFLLRSAAVVDPRQRAAAADLARLERALEAVRGAHEPARQGAPDGEAPALDGTSRLERAVGARLVEFAHDVETGHARWLRGARPGALRARPTALALYRRGDAIVRLRVGPREVPLLRALLAGETLERAVTSASRAGLRPGAIRTALESWVGAGLLSAGRPTPRPRRRAPRRGGSRAPSGRRRREARGPG
jgi:hypothetical protein